MFCYKANISLQKKTSTSPQAKCRALQKAICWNVSQCNVDKFPPKTRKKKQQKQHDSLGGYPLPGPRKQWWKVKVYFGGPLHKNEQMIISLFSGWGIPPNDIFQRNKVRSTKRTMNIWLMRLNLHLPTENFLVDAKFNSGYFVQILFPKLKSHPPQKQGCQDSVSIIFGHFRDLELGIPLFYYLAYNKSTMNIHFWAIEPRKTKKRPYFALNPGCLIGILIIMVHEMIPISSATNPKQPPGALFLFRLWGHSSLSCRASQWEYLHSSATLASSWINWPTERTNPAELNMGFIERSVQEYLSFGWLMVS